MPIVLTTNDVVRNPEHAWNDIEGVQYHYPNQYRKKIQPGVEFVYYRGVHRKDGTRAPAEYFGTGRIGEVRIDPDSKDESRPSWFCSIEDYVPFNPAVPAKINEELIEQIPSNMWRNGVRDLDVAAFRRILQIADKREFVLAARTPTEVENLIAPSAKIGRKANRRQEYRRSKRAKEIGDWAELAAIKFMTERLGVTEIVHRAAISETPGWDIDYLDALGTLQRVEVKGTVAAAFTGVELTAGELKAATEHGAGYWLFLVAGCLGDDPRVHRVQNPWAKLQERSWKMEPTLYRVSF
jgi:Domain of unknown function (DUF3883)